MVGIGNPGDKYRGTRHNVGFEAVDRIAARGGAEFKKERFWNSLRSRVALGGHEVNLLKPLSYVNLSGPAVRKVAEDLEVGLADLLVVLDDFWLPLGKIRVRRRGGGGGHNGLESVIRALGSDEVARLRIGIGEPKAEGAVDHVLSRFRDEEREIADRAIDVAADAAELWVSEGVESAMNRYNQSPEE